MNPAKTKLSFDVRLGGAVLPRNTYTAKDGEQFLKWCGLLINVRTMELQADYTRYAGAKLSASLTISLTKVAPMIDRQSLGTNQLSRILLGCHRLHSMHTSTSYVPRVLSPLGPVDRGHHQSV